ncbi:probable transcriptional regulatory protein Rxyl_1318 [Melozone crissalis]|uniref:probable transcriptional regulatory protein Rxyl_1318 n=1 Tax=Melozone crissalis TaxID=40204 RepID=UPI0023DCBB5C|nr:probable transcriptional regulatory protein Rxyl_1318 [Melozone crissalis]
MAAPVLRVPGLLPPLRAPLRGCLGPCRVPGSSGAVPVPVPVPVRAMAGHNRWSKVRNVKGPRDAERSRLLEKMARMLRAAAREGGADPALNPGLAAVVAQCRTLNVPKATIEGALRSVRERPAGAVPLLLTARGPGGSLALLDVRTDNVRRSQAELRTLLQRHGAALTPDVHPAFQAVGVVRVSGRTLGLEAALDVAAAAGAQDVTQDGAELQFLCAPSALGGVRRGLAAAGLRPLAAAVEFRPRSALALPDGPRAAAERLLRALAERPDVHAIVHNVQDVPAVTPGGAVVAPGGHSAPDTAPATTEERQ